MYNISIISNVLKTSAMTPRCFCTLAEYTNMTTLFHPARRTCWSFEPDYVPLYKNLLASVYVKHAIYNDTNKHAFWRTPWSQSSSFSREIILKISLKNYKKRNTLCHDLVNSMNLWTVLECPVLLLRYTKNRRVAHIIVCDRWNINKNIIIRHLFIV